MSNMSQKLGLIQIDHYTEFLNITQSERGKLLQDDAVWIITSSFIIFTMHSVKSASGFGLLESGSVSSKDEVNIMVKNVVDVVFGGLSYWAVGYGLSYGDAKGFENPFIGFGKFFYDPTRDDGQTYREGWAYASFLFQLSFATTASTIVSGAVAERAKLRSYILLGVFVVLIQALPAHWIWDRNGFFYAIGVVDFAGCSAVHMVGGVIGLMATIYLKPRRTRFSKDSLHQMSSPTNALLGTFMLWWGWFGINSGSVWGITGGRWRLGARSAVATIMSSIGGGATAIVVSFIKTRKLQVNHLIYGLLSSIVSITASAMCAVARPWQAMIIGSVSSAVSISILPLLEKLNIDDPVGVIPVHLTSSIWGMFAVGIFAEDDKILPVTFGQYGLIYSGSFRLLGIQMLCSLTIIVYSAVLGLAVLMGLGKSPIGLRVTDYEEQIGADAVEHGLAGTNIARYHIEKPITAKTFATVTKALTKWKIQTRNHSKALRQQKIQERLKERSEMIERVNSDANRLRLRSHTAPYEHNGSIPHAGGNGMIMNEILTPEKSFTSNSTHQSFQKNLSQHRPIIALTNNADTYSHHLGNNRKNTIAFDPSVKMENGGDYINTGGTTSRTRASIAATYFVLDELKDPYGSTNHRRMSTIASNSSIKTNPDQQNITFPDKSLQSRSHSILEPQEVISHSHPDAGASAAVSFQNNSEDSVAQTVIPVRQQFATSSSIIAETPNRPDVTQNIFSKASKNRVAPAISDKSKN